MDMLYLQLVEARARNRELASRLAAAQGVLEDIDSRVRKGLLTCPCCGYQEHTPVCQLLVVMEQLNKPKV